MENFIFPRRTFVELQCSVCNSIDYNEYDTKSLTTPSFVYCICSNKKCREIISKSLEKFVRSGLYSFGDIFNKFPARVIRSSGDIDEGWNVDGFWFSEDNNYDVQLSKDSLTKTVTRKDFLKVNDGLEESLDKYYDSIINHHKKLFE
jgi:hypothetical protein